MCGIFALLNNHNILTRAYVEEQFLKGKHRGPENSSMNEVMVNATFGFHRLAINGLNDESNQPICIDNVILICNGEIYNYKELYTLMGIQPTTQSDCEVIIHLYKKYGIEQTLQLLDGVFSFCLLDNRIICGTTQMYIGRDPYGVRPLYWLSPEKVQKGGIYGFASELKQLSNMCKTLTRIPNPNSNNTILSLPCRYVVKQFMPGSYSQYELPFKQHRLWRPKLVNKTYHRHGFNTCSSFRLSQPYDYYINNIQTYLVSAIEKRCSTTDRPIACLLSGGLDSSLITALVSEYHKRNGLPPLETYSIGLENGEDLYYARKVADYLGTKHTEVIVTEEDFVKAVPEVIIDIESYDTTTVRASIGNWLLGKYISQHSEAKVIFNGDGSDELTGGYLYMGYAPDSLEFDKECRRLLNDIYMFDVLRSDKSISSHGLEPRTPFLDREWVQYYLTIPYELRFHKNGNRVEKCILRDAFDTPYFSNMNGSSLLPDDVLWRKKEAFSDGVSKHSRSLHTIMFEHALHELMKKTEDITTTIPTSYGEHLLPNTPEQLWYRSIFEEHYSGHGKIVPYFWMPKYVKSTDSSARTLAEYHIQTN
jgi:asparagine synthase (glutamine-hydrolysing)